jgi:PKD repeat protein
MCGYIPHKNDNGVIVLVSRIAGWMSKTVPVLSIVIFSVIIAGCTGSSVVSPTSVPTLVSTPAPSAAPVQTPTPAPIITPTTVPGVPPVALFSYSPPTGSSPWTVSFVDESMDNPTSWLWDFGDGTISTDVSPTHGYSEPGTYNVSLTVTNAAGSNEISYLITISATPTH